ncbi:type IV secretion system protein [Mesorhizobium atlanticum]
MNSLGVIDRFMETFIRYIDSGFGLLSGDVAFLTTILIGIDITLAGLAWAFGGEPNILGRLIRKVLYVGVFAFILNNFKNLADIIYRSFAGLGINASSGNLSADNLLHPGRIAATGFEAACQPLLDQASQLLGFPEIFGNALTFLLLLVALVPWSSSPSSFFRSSSSSPSSSSSSPRWPGSFLCPLPSGTDRRFLAERVLGNVISSGIKVMVLAVIVGIGSTLFAEFASALQGKEPVRGGGHVAGARRARAAWARHLWSWDRLGSCFRRAAARRGRSTGHHSGRCRIGARYRRCRFCRCAHGNRRRSRCSPCWYDHGFRSFLCVAVGTCGLAERRSVRRGCWYQRSNQRRWRRRHPSSRICRWKLRAQHQCRARSRMDRHRRCADRVHDRRSGRFYLEYRTQLGETCAPNRPLVLIATPPCKPRWRQAGRQRQSLSERQG